MNSFDGLIPLVINLAVLGEQVELVRLTIAKLVDRGYLLFI